VYSRGSFQFSSWVILPPQCNSSIHRHGKQTALEAVASNTRGIRYQKPSIQSLAEKKKIMPLKMNFEAHVKEFLKGVITKMKSI